MIGKTEKSKKLCVSSLFGLLKIVSYYGRELLIKVVLN